MRVNILSYEPAGGWILYDYAVKLAEAMKPHVDHVSVTHGQAPGFDVTFHVNYFGLRQLQVPVVCADALNWLREPQPPFDIVFLDPPFALDLWQAAAQALAPSLVPGAWIYVESPAATVPALPADWRLHREGRAGEVRYALYRAGGAG